QRVDGFCFSSRRRHTRFSRDWSSDVCSSDLAASCEHRHAQPRRASAMRVGVGRILIVLVLLVGCASFPRRMQYAGASSAAMNGVRMEHSVYVPPDWRDDEALPLVVFLHGGGDSHDAFDRHGIAARLDRAMTEGRVPRAVILLPSGDLGFWANWYDGTRRYED